MEITNGYMTTVEGASWTARVPEKSGSPDSIAWLRLKPSHLVLSITDLPGSSVVSRPRKQSAGLSYNVLPCFSNKLFIGPAALGCTKCTCSRTALFLARSE